MLKPRPVRPWKLGRRPALRRWRPLSVYPRPRWSLAAPPAGARFAHSRVWPTHLLVPRGRGAGRPSRASAADEPRPPLSAPPLKPRHHRTKARPPAASPAPGARPASREVRSRRAKLHGGCGAGFRPQRPGFLPRCPGKRAGLFCRPQLPAQPGPARPDPANLLLQLRDSCRILWFTPRGATGLETAGNSSTACSRRTA